MATKKRTTRTADRFKVGQQVVLCMTKQTRWERVNGELGVVIGPKVAGTWQSGAPDAIV
jgi:hypothetical protein